MSLCIIRGNAVLVFWSATDDFGWAEGTDGRGGGATLNDWRDSASGVYEEKSAFLRSGGESRDGKFSGDVWDQRSASGEIGVPVVAVPETPGGKTGQFVGLDAGDDKIFAIELVFLVNVSEAIEKTVVSVFEEGGAENEILRGRFEEKRNIGEDARVLEIGRSVRQKTQDNPIHA